MALTSLRACWLRCSKTSHLARRDHKERHYIRLLTQAERKAKEHKLSNLTFQLRDAETAIFEESSFDSILCSSGLIYLQDHDAALRRFLQWLKPGGKLCFNTPQVCTALAHRTCRDHP